MTFAINLKDPHHKLVRWKLRLEEFDYEIRHRPGKQNVVADGLSRIAHEINVNNQGVEESGNSDDETVHSADNDDGEYIQMTELPLIFFKSRFLLEKAIMMRKYMKKYSPKFFVVL